MADGFGAIPSFTAQRARLADDDTLMQTAIAPLEHREFAQEYVKSNPITGPLVMAGAIPAYTAYKALSSNTGARTAPSIDQVFAGFEGVYRGMMANINKSRGVGMLRSLFKQSPQIGVEDDASTITQPAVGGIRG